MGLRELFLTFTAVFFAVFSAQNALAQVKSIKLKKMSEDNVTAFIEDTSILTSNQNIDRDEAKITAYLDRHIDAKARFRTSITYNMPGLPGQKKVLLLKKEDYIAQIKKGADSVEHYYSEVSVDDVQISKNKKTASVNTISIESGIMQVPGEDGETQEIPIEGRSTCFQVLKIGKKGYIQMYSANCETVMDFLPN